MSLSLVGILLNGLARGCYSSLVSRRSGHFLKQLFFTIDQRVDIVSRQLEPVPMSNGVGWAGFHAIAAENTTGIIDVVHAGITLAGGNAIGIDIFRGFNINTIRRAGSRAQETAYAFFQAAFVAVTNVNPAIPRLKVDLFVRIIFRHRLAKHVGKRDAETLHQGAECLADVLNDGRHDGESLTERGYPRQIRPYNSRFFRKRFRNLFAVKAPVFDKDFAGVQAADHHSSKVNSRNVALVSYRIHDRLDRKS